MSGPTRLSETEIEDLIRGVPARQPPPHLRARVLDGAVSRERRPTLLRPAIALAALVVLVLLDIVVLGRQERRLASALGTSGGAVVAQHLPRDDSLSDLDIIGAPYLSARLHGTGADGETYLQLRSRLLENGEGG